MGTVGCQDGQQGGRRRRGDGRPDRGLSDDEGWDQGAVRRGVPDLVGEEVLGGRIK